MKDFFEERRPDNSAAAMATANREALLAIVEVLAPADRDRFVRMLEVSAAAYSAKGDRGVSAELRSINEEVERGR